MLIINITFLSSFKKVEINTSAFFTAGTITGYNLFSEPLVEVQVNTERESCDQACNCSRSNFVNNVGW